VDVAQGSPEIDSIYLSIYIDLSISISISIYLNSMYITWGDGRNHHNLHLEDGRRREQRGLVAPGHTMLRNENKRIRVKGALCA